MSNFRGVFFRVHIQDLYLKYRSGRLIVLERGSAVNTNLLGWDKMDEIEKGVEKKHRKFDGDE